MKPEDLSRDFTCRSTALVKASKMFRNLSLAASVVTGREGANHEQKTHFSITFLNVFTDEQAFLCRLHISLSTPTFLKNDLFNCAWRFYCDCASSPDEVIVIKHCLIHRLLSLRLPFA